MIGVYRNKSSFFDLTVIVYVATEDEIDFMLSQDCNRAFCVDDSFISKKDRTLINKCYKYSGKSGLCYFHKGIGKFEIVDFTKHFLKMDLDGFKQWVRGRKIDKLLL